MKAKHIVPVLTAALMLTACGSGSSNAGAGEEGETYNWDFTVTVSDTSSWYLGAERFAEILNEESDGRITVNVYANEQLSGGDAAAGVEQLMNGDKAFSYNSTIIYSGIDPRYGAINAPFLYKDYEEADAAIEAGALDAYKELANEQGVELLGFGESGFRQITNNSKEIVAPEDLKALKFRVPGSSMFLDIYSAMDADPITMNFSEVFTSLQNGTIDGQENPYDVIASNGLMEVQEYLTVWNYIYDPLMLGMNKDMYEELSDSDKELVQKAAAEANELQKKTNRERGEEQLAEMKSTMTVTELNEEQVSVFRDSMGPIYDKYESVWTADLAEAVKPK
ncbi:DctP family TRAP transporter solute-binding subunit [Arthrobacter sp. zg-Y769]|uniref:DctP family TRAP transporter solute-binding subunit n=1 Tax=Arthrobacter sp. zg-Y769 TaxID=2894191 RepID=UPI001E5D2F3D|nr:DctP family TRAP transporter solute-binding subunit [Arthrobacter sp. zg-Y769]MCC9204220.1 DctP family TRAP transporter solute-binding subunit [Arthrobacter sp. zg-Y769]